MFTQNLQPIFANFITIVIAYYLLFTICYLLFVIDIDSEFGFMVSVDDFDIVSAAFNFATCFDDVINCTITTNYRSEMTSWIKSCVQV